MHSFVTDIRYLIQKGDGYNESHRSVRIVIDMAVIILIRRMTIIVNCDSAAGGVEREQ